VCELFQLSASFFAESDANEEVVNRFLDFNEAELPC
jgi:hypothetical protein